MQCWVGSLVFSDPQGNELFSLKNRHFTISKSFYGEAPDGSTIFEVKGHFSCKQSPPFLSSYPFPLCIIRHLTQSPPPP